MIKSFQLFALAIVVLATSMLTSCTPSAGTRSGGARSAYMGNPNHPAVKQRNAQIAQEPRGSYFIGRRWWTEGTRFWGYLRRPGEPWSKAKLVMIDESATHTPDRLAEEPANGGPRHGFDHNYEYRFYGSFTGGKIYDPNSNLELPEFRLTRYELINQNPGFLFAPGEKYSRKRLPPKIPPIPR